MFTTNPTFFAESTDGTWKNQFLLQKEKKKNCIVDNCSCKDYCYYYYYLGENVYVLLPERKCI
jgi:hypothetical protein